MSRQGGDEFLIVLTDFNIPDDAAEKILTVKDAIDYIKSKSA